jgi:hypothetical protein
MAGPRLAAAPLLPVDLDRGGPFLAGPLYLNKVRSAIDADCM